MKLEDYLSQKYSKNTIVMDLRYIKRYLDYAGEKQAKGFLYKDIVNYIGTIRKVNNKPAFLNNNLLALKKYYDWLFYTKKREDHPCKNLNLIDRVSKNIQLQDLFKEEELELLLERKERCRNVKLKNQVILSLMIYQGLTNGEIVKLRTTDINMDEGAIYVRSSSQSNSRTLYLKSKQVMIFHKYLNEERVKLLSKKGAKKHKATDALIITWRGTPENGEGINYLISTFKYLFHDRNLNPKTIRMSVISNLLKQGKDLRLVQVFAGHKSASTTEKYKQSQVEELQSEINKYHPLG